MFRIIILVIISYSLHAQEQVAITLDDAVILGVERNYGLNIADNAVSIAENNNNWSEAGRFLNLDLVATSPQAITRNNRPASFINGEIYSGSAGVQLQADLPIYQGGQVKINKKVLENNLQNARTQRDLNLANTVRAIKLQYYNTMLSRAGLEVIDNVLQQSRDRLAYEETRKEFGQSSTFKSTQFESNVLSDSTQLIDQMISYNQSILELARLLNIDPDSVRIFPLDTLAFNPIIYDEPALKNVLINENIELQQALLDQKQGSLQLELEKTRRKLFVNLTGSLGFTENAFAFLSPPDGFEGGLQFGNEATIGATVTARYNLLNGGRNNRAIENAKIQLESIQYQIDDLKLSLSNQLISLIEQYNDLLAQVNMQNRNLLLSRRNIDIGLEQLQAGKINSLDYRDLQLNYINAEFNRLTTLHALGTIETNIEWLTGQLN